MYRKNLKCLLNVCPDKKKFTTETLRVKIDSMYIMYKYESSLCVYTVN